MTIAPGKPHELAVVFPGDASGPLLLAQGHLTAASVWRATGCETWSAIGTVAGVNLDAVPHGRMIVICRDDDARNAQARNGLGKAKRRWRAEGRRIVDAWPWERTRGDGSNFNDAMQTHGRDYVRARIEAALSPAEPASNALPVTQAREQLKRATAAAFERLVAWDDLSGTPPPTLCIGTSLGSGKTKRALREAVRLIGEGGGPVVYAVPRHDLGAELVERAIAEAEKQHVALTVATWRGREADDPDAPGKTMCRDLEAVLDVQHVGGDPQETVCRRKMKDGTVRACAHFETCAYQRQRKQKATLWFVAHHAQFAKKPKAIGKPALVIIDEAFWSAGLRGFDGRAVLVTPEQLAEPPVIVRKGRIANDATADLRDELMPIRRRLLAALAEHPLGPIQIERLVEAGLTADDCAAARKGEWNRKVAVEVLPGMSADERRACLERAKDNAELPRMARLWLDLQAVLEGGSAPSGRVELVEQRDDETGATYRALRLRWLKPIAEGWTAPTLHIDATLNLDLVRAYLPDAELVADIAAAAPHQRVTQVTGKSFAGRSLAKTPRQIDQVWTAAVARARCAGGRWLVVAQKDIEDQIRARHAVPEFIDLAHHNGVSGRDHWRDVRGLVVIGRTQPPPAAVEAMAGALTGQAVEPVKTPDGWYPAEPVTLQDRAGQVVTVEVDRHPDPMAEAVRAAICEGELLQIIGRARGVNRTAAEPLEVLVYGNVPVPGLAIDALETWHPPTIDDEMLARGAWLEGAGDAAAAHGCWTAKQIEGRRDQERGRRLSPLSYEKYLYEGGDNLPPRHLTPCRYQKAGPGRSRKLALVDLRTVPDPRAWLVARLGPLVHFEAVGPPPAAEVRPAVPEAPADAVSEPAEAPAEIAAAAEIPVAAAEPPGAGRLEPAVDAPAPAPGSEAGSRVSDLQPGLPPVPPWPGGLLGDAERAWARERIRGAGVSQDDVARAAGLSRPQLTNALQGRFGLSPPAAARVLAALAALTLRQPGLLPP